LDSQKWDLAFDAGVARSKPVSRPGIMDEPEKTEAGGYIFKSYRKNSPLASRTENS
jgi:hypothetical protein